LPQPFAAKPIGLPFFELQSVDSTNNYARQQIHAGLAQHGTAFFAHEQLAGKGQRNKVWTAARDANIILSLVIEPEPLKLTRQFQLNACIAVAVHDFFTKYAGDKTRIKWPNDLYWQDRKAGGILIENIVRGREPAPSSEFEVRSSQWISIVGVGININQTSFPDTLKNPVSLKQITGRDFDTVALAKELSAGIDSYFKQLITAGFDPIFEQYLLQLYKRKEKVKLKKDSRVFEATILGISPMGKLMVQHSIAEEFNFGEVEWIM
jgi:BirA family biotin operon repressor/biotin-[acetyl-CoA-carboxylase] ligase